MDGGGIAIIRTHSKMKNVNKEQPNIRLLTKIVTQNELYEMHLMGALAR